MPSRFNRVMAIVVWVTSAAVALGAAWNPASGATPYAAAALLAFFAWAALWRPYVGLDDVGVTLRNVTHRVVVPWPALIHVDTRMALTLHTPGRAFSAWAAPAPSALSAAVTGRRAGEREARAAGSALRPGDLLGTESGNAAVVIREQWQARVARGSIAAGEADRYQVTREWDLPVIAIGCALVVATVWTLAGTT